MSLVALSSSDFNSFVKMSLISGDSIKALLLLDKSLTSPDDVDLLTMDGACWMFSSGSCAAYFTADDFPIKMREGMSHLMIQC